MCGIFGLVVPAGTEISFSKVQKTLSKLYRLSESRGKESAGLHAFMPGVAKALTLKGDLPASDFIRSRSYLDAIEKVGKLACPNTRESVANSLALLAHSRLVTNGAAEVLENNQPVTYGSVNLVHNGIVVNVEELWEKESTLQATSDVDSELIAALLDQELKQGRQPAKATQNVFDKLFGAASIAWTSEGLNSVVLASNTGDLYYLQDFSSGCLIFASERHFLELALDNEVESKKIEWIPAGNLLVVDMATGKLGKARLDDSSAGLDLAEFHKQDNFEHEQLLLGASTAAELLLPKADESLIRYNEASIRNLKRCTSCILPETFPFISFDSDGVCSYCRSYKPRYREVDAESAKAKFIKSLEKYHGNGTSPDVIVPFSGGRDSCYGLHLIKKEFGLTPTTFTYDWGMVTDLARRNTARLCGELGVQNILVSADIKMKRRNIRSNVSAWLKRPELGLVPLFMAGDKHFFSVVNQIKRQTGIKLDLWSANPLENTDFKSGFCGVSPDFDKERLDYLSMGRKLKMAMYYGVNFLKNPGYINSSIIDTLRAFSAYYFEPRNDFYFMFDHMVWNEDEVNKVLLSEYDFELAPDSSSSWRIGDGTAPFYNYIYVTSRGFCEFDTFRSNQIREGMITREAAMEEVVNENQPRVESLRWYLDAIGLDFNQVVPVINRMDTMGLHC